jgi:hypothetical protein
MNIVEQFDIAKNNVLEIVIPDFKDKYNYYYEPTQFLNKFDEVSVVLRLDDKECVIMTEIIQDIACALRSRLKNALQNKAILPPHIALGELNLFYSREDYKNYWQDENLPYECTVDYQQFWLWSTSGKTQSWMYNHDGKIYLEIGEIYKNPDNDERDDRLFAAYIKNYKPLFIGEIKYDVACEWLHKSERLINIIDSEYALNFSQINDDEQ